MSHESSVPSQPTHGSPIVVRRIYIPTRREAMQIIRIYRDCFLPEQRIAESSLLGTIDERPKRNTNAFLVAEREGEIIAFTFVLFFPSFRMAHMMYLGVAAGVRRQHVGERLFEALIDCCNEFSHPPHWLTVETLRPEAAKHEAERAERQSTLDFLRKCGCQQVVADFQAPPLGPFSSVLPFWILARPVADANVDPHLVPDMLRVIYRMVYGLPEEHTLVRHCLQSLGTLD